VGRIGKTAAGPLPLLCLVLLPLLLSAGCALELRDRIEEFVGAYEAIRLEKAVYVSLGGDDGNPGTREHPKRSLQAALDLAGALTGELGRLEVRTAAGTYIITAPVELRDKVSLRGGYDPADWSRDVEANETVIAAQGAEKVVAAGAGITAAAAIEGFTLRAAAEDTVCCVYCNGGSPTIRDNMIDAGPGVLDSSGIFCISSSPRIMANTIDAGKGSANCRGIVCQGAAAVIRNNVVYYEAGGGDFLGILCNNSTGVIIQNNTIRGGQETGGSLIYCWTSTCVIENNILYASPEAVYGIYEADTASLPERVNNNDFYGCSPLYRGAVGPTSCGTVAAMEAYLAGQPEAVPAAGNREEDPVFVDAAAQDYHLGGASPLRDQGLDLSAWFGGDREGAPRTVPWSIGAYELDL
jgi:hypothetical protein